ncbi:MAG: hypothetical protein AAGU02_06025 [Lawsonibacter sp.]
MNAITLYKIYETTRENQAPDLTIGLAMYKAEHPGVITHEQDREIREFMGRHGQELAKAFPDPEAFAKAVSAGEAEDAEKAAEAK